MSIPAQSTQLTLRPAGATARGWFRLVLSLWLGLASPAWSTTNTAPSLEVLEAKSKEIEASTAVAEEAKRALLEQYRTIRTQLEEARTFTERAAEYRDALERAPAETAALRAQLEAALARPTPQAPVKLPAHASAEEIERLLAREQAEASALEARLAELDKAVEDLERQPTTARARLVEARLALEQLADELKLTAGEVSGDERQARQWLASSRHDRLRAEILMLEQQILSAGARLELARVRRDLVRQNLAVTQERRTWLRAEADRVRRAEAEQVRAKTERTEQALADAHPLARQLARDNAALSERISALTEELNQLAAQQAELEQLRARIDQEFRDARQRLEAAGLSRALGLMLLDQRQRLPESRVLRQGMAQRAEIISTTSLELIQMREEWRQLSTPSTAVEEWLIHVAPEERAALRAALADPLRQRRELLGRSIALEERHLRALAELDDAAQRLLHTSEAYAAFLAERLLWVRSVVPLFEQDFAPLPAAVGWLLAPAHWHTAGAALLAALPSVRWPWLSTVLAVFVLFASPRLRRAIRASAEPLRRVSTDRFLHTLHALLMTLLLALPWSLLLYSFGWTLNQAVETTAFAKAMAFAAMHSAVALYYLRAFRLICMPGGVADRHFRWHCDTLAVLRREFGWATASLIPLGFVAALLTQQPDPGYSGTLGRLTLVSFLFGLAWFMGRLLHPRHGALAPILAEQPQSWLNRTRALWYPTVVAIPLLLALLALAGYLYTAGMLLKSLISELWLILALIVVQQAIVRWLMVARRSLALQAALDRRAQDHTAERSSDSLVPPEEEIDLAALDEQTRRLVNSTVVIAGALGSWLIWAEVLPALKFLEHIELWQYTGTVKGQEQSLPFTVADLGVVLLVSGFALIAAKNLPALLEIILLRYTAVSPGTRYAVTTLTGYGIAAAAILLVAGTLGLSWSQVQWLVAALSVGIGFGLQEIVANFISGLIILFERPIRVGDVVSIDNTTGVVTKINIRATTIRNWDRQELLVPNKEFITGRLLNWTLTDAINRVVITVGVEYGSDTRKALELLAEAAREHPEVLDNPPPLVTFEGFGDNALTLVLRCFLSTPDNRLTVNSELHQTIDDKFKAAGIGIAFPQRDLHLRSAAPLELRLVRTPAARSPTARPAPPALDDAAPHS